MLVIIYTFVQITRQATICWIFLSHLGLKIGYKTQITICVLLWQKQSRLNSVFLAFITVFSLIPINNLDCGQLINEQLRKLCFIRTIKTIENIICTIDSTPESSQKTLCDLGIQVRRNGAVWCLGSLRDPGCLTFQGCLISSLSPLF